MNYTGNTTVKVFLLFSLVALILPLCASTISLAIASPRPAPPELVERASSSL